jgi:hypothetical protein
MMSASTGSDVLNNGGGVGENGGGVAAATSISSLANAIAERQQTGSDLSWLKMLRSLKKI